MNEGDPQPGSLGIRERRSWQTWQLLVGAIVASLLGMFVGYLGGGGSSGKASAATGGHGYHLPPPTGATATTDTTAPATASDGSATTVTTVAGADATTATTAPTGPAIVLVPRTQAQGNWTSPQFTVSGGTWNIGWAFRCTPAPSAGVAFAVFAVPIGQSPSSPAVSETQGSGQGVTPQTTAGAQVIEVQAPPNCQWVVKVTGYGTP